MAIFSVFATKIQLLPHPNAERLELARVGMHQLVVGKGNYNDGDIIIFAPERSILPDNLKGEYINTDTGKSYLTGPDSNRVKSVNLRGELSEGATIPVSYVLANVPEWNSIEDIPLDIDISEKLGITKYEPPLPSTMNGILAHQDSLHFEAPISHHDVEGFKKFKDEFLDTDICFAVEKLNGSQFNAFFSKTGEIGVSSKGYNSRDLVIERSEKNLYWQALENSGLIDFVKCTILEANAPELYKSDVQLMGEVIPCQKNFSYGQTKPTLKLFRLKVNGYEYSIPELEKIYGIDWLKKYWAPILYHGKFDPDIFEKLSKGMEQVSGKELHIKEGIVVSPEVPRIARRGFPLFLKVLNPKYKETGEEFN